MRYKGHLPPTSPDAITIVQQLKFYKLGKLFKVKDENKGKI